VFGSGERVRFSTIVGRVPCGDSLEFIDRKVIEPM
jgi:hypothetical protein